MIPRPRRRSRSSRSERDCWPASAQEFSWDMIHPFPEQRHRGPHDRRRGLSMSCVNSSRRESIRTRSTSAADCPTGFSTSRSRGYLAFRADPKLGGLSLSSQRLPAS